MARAGARDRELTDDEWLEATIDAEVAKLFAMSDGEIRQMIIAEGEDPDKVVAAMKKQLTDLLNGIYG